MKHLLPALALLAACAHHGSPGQTCIDTPRGVIEAALAWVGERGEVAFIYCEPEGIHTHRIAVEYWTRPGVVQAEILCDASNCVELKPCSEVPWGTIGSSGDCQGYPEGPCEPCEGER